MKNKKSLLKYIAIPLFGASMLIPSCGLDDGNHGPQTYEIKLGDKNNDGLKDLVIQDLRGEIKDVYLQKKDGTYISVKEAYRLEKLKKINQFLEGRHTDSEDKKEDDSLPLLLNPVFTPYFFPTSN